jgi:hypothetical protein
MLVHALSLPLYPRATSAKRSLCLLVGSLKCADTYINELSVYTLVREHVCTVFLPLPLSSFSFKFSRWIQAQRRETVTVCMCEYGIPTPVRSPYSSSSAAATYPSPAPFSSSFPTSSTSFPLSLTRVLKDLPAGLSCLPSRL